MATTPSSAPVPFVRLSLHLPVRAANAGFFISRGRGRHPERVIDSQELILVNRGRLGMFEEERGFDLGPGDALLLTAGRRHGGTAPYPPDLAFYWLHFHWVADSAPAAAAGGAAGEPVLELPATVHLAQPERVEDLLRRFLNDQEAGCLDRPVADLLLLQILAELAAAAAVAGRPEGGATGPGAVLASRARQLIQSRFHQGLSTARLARELHCNPDYLGRQFKAVCRMTLVEAIHQQQIAKARALLQDSPLNSREIAQACGFRDAIYFRRVFKQHAGLAPLAFRRLYARRHVNTE
ncbi:MAG: AraC family transcriptional regulator [Lentisphaeria bacterium]